MPLGDIREDAAAAHEKQEAKGKTRPYRDAKRLANVIKRRNRVPALTELVENIVAEWGGAERLAQDLRETYNQAPVGTSTRARILERVFDLVRINADLFGEQDEWDSMEPDEIIDFIASEMRDVFKEEAEGESEQGEPDGPGEREDAVGNAEEKPTPEAGTHAAEAEAEGPPRPAGDDGTGAGDAEVADSAAGHESAGGD
jgi:hypothetical protein